ncbi:MAG: hypothetical protein LEGION0403_FIIPPAGN_02649 [Legionella sp.]
MGLCFHQECNASCKIQDCYIPEQMNYLLKLTWQMLFFSLFH